MKKYILITAFVFIGTSVYAIDLPGGLFNRHPKKEAPQKEVKKEAAAKEAPKPAVSQAAPQAAPKAVAQAPEKTLTREEKIVRIVEMLKVRPNIVSAIQGLEAKGSGDTASYLYNGKKIEDLDETTLTKLMAMISQQISIENLQKFDRQQRQLKNLHQIEQMNRTQRALREQRALSRSSTPKIYKAPKIPRTRY
ncbi:MAG: hypothetical protein V1682_00120 [Candidatus Omnitrophota bacterium]